MTKEEFEAKWLNKSGGEVYVFIDDRDFHSPENNGKVVSCLQEALDFRQMRYKEQAEHFHVYKWLGVNPKT